MVLRTVIKCALPLPVHATGTHLQHKVVAYIHKPGLSAFCSPPSVRAGTIPNNTQFVIVKQNWVSLQLINSLIPPTVFCYSLRFLHCSLQIIFTFGNQTHNQSLQFQTQAPTHKIPEKWIAGKWEDLPGEETLSCHYLSSCSWVLLKVDFCFNSVITFA